VIFIQWAFFAFLAYGIFALRRRADYQPAYRTWGFPVVPVIFIVASLAIVFNRLRAEPIDSVIGLALVGLGVPVYAWGALRAKRTDRVLTVEEAVRR
jgi:APA family basic amino acid/polyamine antiporter